MGNTTIPGTSKELVAAAGVPAFANADELNARLTSSHWLVGAEALLDELDPTFASLRAELAQVGDDTLRADDGRVIGVVAGNTYGHYEEHAKELGLE